MFFDFGYLIFNFEHKDKYTSQMLIYLRVIKLSKEKIMVRWMNPVFIDWR